MIVTIDVTKEDIVTGNPTGWFDCPVALAINRVTTPTTSVGIRTWGFGVSDYTQPDLPEWVGQRILGFSDKREGWDEPFSFELDIPKEFLR